MAQFTHLDSKGSARMVDVGSKPLTKRRAVAVGHVFLPSSVAEAIASNTVAKGNVFETARIGAIQAAKKTFELIPLCHQIPLTHIDLHFQLTETEVLIRSEVSAEARTGVEMEALTAASVAALIVYDMCKGIDKDMRIGPIELLEKEGGKSGTWKNPKNTASR
jgi:cyclic pyranopterin monophosphate synthase